jgi:hypothetical protein
MHKRAIAWLLLLLPLLSLGCGKSYPLAPVSGRVTMDGEPLAKAEVRFFPTDDKDLPFSTGTTDENGNYELYMVTETTTSRGAIIGTHRVTISVDQRKGKIMPVHRPGMPRMSKPGETIPSKYNKDSKMAFIVPPEGTKEANFDLKSR